MMRLPRFAASGAAALVVWTAVATAGVPSPRRAATDADRQGASTRLIDVPFLPQTEDLCGGAAVAMVMRYWGERQIYPADFAALVDRSAAGIRTDALVDDVRRRGWQAATLAAGTGADIAMAGHVERGRPIVALIEVRPGRYHYVVVVAWTHEQVIVHDPARAPFRVMPRPEFDRAWTAAGRWALVVVPGGERASALQPLREMPAVDGRPAAGTCGPLIRTLVDQARAGDVAGAERGLLAAVGLCPDDPAAWRELAGIRFLQTRWAEAGVLAERAARLDPGDRQGLDLLGTSRFLNGEPDRALGAWNRMGRPSVDTMHVVGASRTRHPVIVALADLPPRTLLTPERLARSARRLQELPSAATTRLRYAPVDDGLAEIEAVVVERPVVPHGVVPLAAVAARAWLSREIRLDVAAPTGSGELWTVAWRRWDARPRVAFALAVPSVGWLPGVITIDGLWERSSYDLPGASGASVVRDEHRRAAIGLADWATSQLRWQAGVSLDRWAGTGHAAVNAGLDWRLAHDHMSVGVDTAAWMPTASGARFATVAATYAVRSTREPTRPAWTLASGLAQSTSGAPFDLWLGAGTGLARVPLLRAHPLLDDGVVGGPAFGRRLAHATAEYQHPLRALAAGSVRVAAFADTARAWERPGAGGRGSWHTDIGAGVRVALPGLGGTLRADVARGLRDGRVAVSAGWLAPWPGR